MNRTEYRITGRARKNTKRHVVDCNVKWTLQDAEKRLVKLIKQSEYEIKNRTRKAISAGVITVGTEYYGEYDLLELRIESREVSPWGTVESEVLNETN